MDRVRAGRLGNPDDFRNGKIALDWSQITGQMRATPHLIALVRFEPMQRKFIFLCPYGHRFDAKLVGGAEHADGNFGSVGDKNLPDLQSYPPRQ